MALGKKPENPQDDKMSLYSSPESDGGNAALRVFDKSSVKLKKAVRSSVFGHILLGSEITEERAAESLIIGSISNALDSNRHIVSAKHAVARCADSSVMLKLFARLRRNTMLLPVRSIGVMLFFFGLYSSVIYSVKRFVQHVDFSDLSSLVLGVACVMLSLLMMLSGKSLVNAMRSSRIMNAFVEKVMCTRINLSAYSSAYARKSSAPFVIGTFLGMATYFFPAMQIFVAALILIFTALIFCSPETGAALTVLIIPFAGVKMLCAVIALTFVAYLFKLVRGKRVIVMSFSKLLPLILIFTAAVRLSAFGELTDSTLAVLVSLAMLYTVILGLVRSKPLQADFTRLLLSGTVIYVLACVAGDFFRAEGVKVLSAFADHDGHKALCELLLVMMGFFAVRIAGASGRRGFARNLVLVPALSLMLLYFVYSGSAAFTAGLVAGVIFVLLCSGSGRLFAAIPLTLILPAAAVMLRFSVREKLLPAVFGSGGAIAKACDSVFRSAGYETEGIYASDLLTLAGIAGVTVALSAIVFFIQEGCSCMTYTRDVGHRLRIMGGCASVISVAVYCICGGRLPSVSTVFMLIAAVGLTFSECKLSIERKHSFEQLERDEIMRQKTN